MVRKVSSIIAASIIVVFAISITSVRKNEKQVEKTKSSPTEIINIIRPVALNQESKTSSPGIKPANSDKNSVTASSNKGTTSTDKKSSTSTTSAEKTYKEVLAIGDSIMVGIGPTLKKKITNITVDGKVSRQMTDAVKLAPSYSKYNNTDNAIIIELGTNGSFTDKTINSLLNSFSKAHVFLVNTRVPRKWEKTVNDSLKKKADEKENVTLVDWYSVAIKHPEYFGHDGVHLKSSGVEALTSLISETINKVLNSKK